jgi:hypothetical protein
MVNLQSILPIFTAFSKNVPKFNLFLQHKAKVLSIFTKFTQFLPNLHYFFTKFNQFYTTLN